MSTVKDSNRREVDGRGQLYQRTTIDVLLDDVLIEVFSFYLDLGRLDAWYTLVHVSRRWRQLVFASPRRLNLRLLCTHTTRRSVKKLLDIWPALPIVIKDYGTLDIADFDAALEHRDRICEIAFDPLSSPLLNSMKKPLPALTSLKLVLRSYNYLVLPNSFLGGSAPRLRSLTLYGFAFWGLPELLSSAHHLVHLSLYDIPNCSPVALVSHLSSLTNLKELALGFQSCRYHPDQRNRHRPIVLSSLTSLRFGGVSKNLEDIVARIDVPLLSDIKMRFFDVPIFDTPLLPSFISRTEAFKVFHRAKMHFSYDLVEVTLMREGGAHNGVLKLGIASCSSDRRLSSVAQVFKSSLPLLPLLEQLYICQYPSGLYWEDDIVAAQWLELLHPFITVKSLYLEKDLAPHVAPALQELAGESAAEVFPALQNVFVQGPAPQSIAQFIAARELLGHPVAAHDWDGKWLE